MATITITRHLDVMVSVFNQNAIRFIITSGVIPTVTIEGINFMPTKVNTIGSVDTYEFDLTDILRYVIGFPPLICNPEFYPIQKALTIYISAPDAETKQEQTVLSFGCQKIGETYRMISVHNGGAFDTIYHDSGAVGFYFRFPSGYYYYAIQGLEGAGLVGVDLVNGYNNLQITEAMYFASGRFIVYDSFGDSKVGFDVVYNNYYQSLPDNTNYKQLQWINADGSWSKYYFRLTASGNDVKSSNPIPIYTAVHADIVGKSRDITKEKKSTIQLDIVTTDEEHFRQLCEIAESPCILYDEKILCSVKSAPTSTSLCRQNLKFNLTLEYDNYVATY